ncbi:uncharacterized protein LOC131618723 [Vicia villosa]|uniref:uncharacterized protein LOC131618723 n=1 Tax=Vicia villosa TaxID=3911 RepID=UPI00273AD290|nr:uncharacterized protein LOC131618723 [Vicia villosa]
MATSECKHKEMICFNRGEEGHIGNQCQKPKKAQVGGKLFALAGTQTANDGSIAGERVNWGVTLVVTEQCLVEMAGRNNAAIAAALEAMAQALANQPNADENAGSRKTHQRLEVAGEEVTWIVFRREFLRKYYPEDVRGKKEIEFLELKQCNMSVTEYAAKFTELAKFYPYYEGAGAEFSKCIKFENGLRSEIKKVVGYQKIRIFPNLVDSCRIYEEDHNAHYKLVKDRRGKQNRSTPYDALVGKGKAEVANGKKTSGGGAPASVFCFKCGEPGHKSDVCTAVEKRCFRCGKTGHAISDCKHKEMICFNCGEEGHIGNQCQKPKKAEVGGKVFALAGTQTANDGSIAGESVCLVEMAGRNDAAIAAALEAMAQALANQPNADENAGSRSLATF